MKCTDINGKRYTEYCDKRELCVAIEHKRKYVLKNISKKVICKIKIDGGYIKDKTVNKCDYGFLICDDKHIILVELKGKDFFHAITQINSTVLLKIKELENLRVSARIVLSRLNVPNIENNPAFLKLKRFIKRKNGDIKYQSRLLSERY